MTVVMNNIHDQLHSFVGNLVQEQIGDVQIIDAGGIIFESTLMKDHLAILTKGKARIIDNNKTFSNQTISQVSDPFIFGLSELLKRPYTENIRAISNCEIIRIDLSKLDANYKKWFYTYARQSLDEAEWPYLYRLLKQRFQKNISTIKRGKDFSTNCRVINTQSEYYNFSQNRDFDLYPIIYIDESRSGFSYGQFITPEICQISFEENRWPRLLIYREALEIRNENNINTDKTLKKPAKSNNDKSPATTKNHRSIDYVDNAENKINNDRDGFTVRRSTNKRDSYYSCLMMINDYFKLPSKNDAIQRSADFLVSRDGTWSDDILRILDKFGLAVREIRIDTRQSLNIPIPSLWIDSVGNCQIISAKSNKSISIIDPLEGRIKIDQNEAYKNFAQILV